MLILTKIYITISYLTNIFTLSFLSIPILIALFFIFNYNHSYFYFILHSNYLNLKS